MVGFRVVEGGVKDPEEEAEEGKTGLRTDPRRGVAVAGLLQDRVLRYLEELLTK